MRNLEKAYPILGSQYTQYHDLRKL